MRAMLLLLFVVQQTPVLPAAAALVVWLDGSHQVEFRSDSNHLTLLLHHQRKQGQSATALPEGHQHGLLTRAVLTFAMSQGGEHPDHCLSFSDSKDGYEQSHALVRPGIKWVEQSAYALHAGNEVVVARDVPMLKAFEPRARDRVSASPGLVGLRTIVQLI